MNLKFIIQHYPNIITITILYYYYIYHILIIGIYILYRRIIVYLLLFSDYQSPTYFSVSNNFSLFLLDFSIQPVLNVTKLIHKYFYGPGTKCLFCVCVTPAGDSG